MLSTWQLIDKLGKLTGGRKVSEATSHLPLKIKKSARGIPGAFDFAVRTQKIEGSM